MRLKSIILGALLACGLNASDDKVIVIGATPVPHAEILKFIQPALEKQGYEMQIKVFNDYIIPNKAVEEGQLDANFFQHVPYMEEFNNQKGTHLVKTVGVHVEPMGVYSKKIKTLDNLKDGSKIGIPNDPTNRARALKLLQSAKLIVLNDNALATPKDIVKNPKKLEFLEIEAAQLPRTLRDTAASVINTNFALSAGLNPLKDALVIEGKDSPYANIVSVKDGNQDKAKIKALDSALNSNEVKEFIIKKYKGAIVPAF